MPLGYTVPPEDKFSPIKPVQAAQPAWLRAVSFPLRPLRQATRYLRYRMILQRRKNRKTRAASTDNTSSAQPPDRDSGIDKLV